jgi:hypothetical protein
MNEAIDFWSLGKSNTTLCGEILQIQRSSDLHNRQSQREIAVLVLRIARPRSGSIPVEDGRRTQCARPAHLSNIGTFRFVVHIPSEVMGIHWTVSQLRIQFR